MPTPTESSNDFPMTEINLSAEIRRMWGKAWNEPELEYEFSNGRKFYRRTEHAAIYETSPDF